MMSLRRRNLILLVILFLIFATSSCSFTSQQTEEEVVPPEEPAPTATTAPIFPEEEMTVTVSDGALLSVPAGALSEDATVALAEIGEGVPFTSGSPFKAASDEYLVDLGEAQQVGEITLTIPIDDQIKLSAKSQDQVYLAWTEPEAGMPSVVGAIVEDGQATLPVVGPGKYQVFGMLSHEALVSMASLFEPLTVPTYPQMTPAWCSPTALTNLVQYHSGSWPAGGYGHLWGESSNWYLAGKAGQAYDHGYFFHWLLGAGGYSVPADVKQSFSDQNAEVIIWNWKAAIYTVPTVDEIDIVLTNYAYADTLFDAFQSYIEHHVWGINGPRRPVAWGSSLAGHSRTITGSNGEILFFNNPSSGSLNDSTSWADYRQAVMDSLTAEKTEVIDTVALQANPRPDAERRGVIWLVPFRESDGFPGSVALIQGNNEQPATNWHWDGSMGHEKGYFYEDLTGALPDDPLFGVEFKATDLQDEVEYGFAVFNISDTAYDFKVIVALMNETLSVLETVSATDVSLAAGQRQNIYPAGSFHLFDLPPDHYILKFQLNQDGIFQDVKYVQFRLAEPSVFAVLPQGVLVKNAYCRKGPDPVFDDVTAFEAGTELELIGVNPDRTWGKVQATVNEITFQCWISLSAMEVTGDAPVLEPPPMPEPESSTCVSTLDKEACEAAGGVFVLGIIPICECPEE